MAERKLTIRDIARLSGVSRSTVSLVLNNDRRISEETKQKVQAVIRRSGYEPNAMARSLARRRAGMVAVVVPRTSSHVFSDYYFSEAISGIGDVLAARGYRMLIEMASEQFVRDQLHHKLFREAQVDGMLLVGALTTDDYIAEIGRRFNVVLVNSMLDDIPSVSADNFQGALRMMEHLVALGHRRIAYIGGLDITTVGADRSRGYREGLAAAGLDSGDPVIDWGNFSEQSGYESGGRLLDRRPRPTAIFAANDRMAIGCLRAAEERRLRVPADVTVVGADDVELASYVRPRLTTIRQPIYEIGRQATELILRRAESEIPAARPGPSGSRVNGGHESASVDSSASVHDSADSSPHLHMATELVIRESSAPPPAGAEA